MKRFLVTLLFLPLALIAGSLVDGNNAFAIELYQQVARSGGNLNFSPFAINLNLSMPYLGARGPTAEEMARVLHYPPLTLQELAKSLYRLDQRLSGADIVAGMWLPNNQPVLHSYQMLLQEGYPDALHEAIFHTPSMVAVEINQWMSESTQGVVRRLMEPISLGKSASIVLASSFTLNAPWLLPFNVNHTSQKPFGRGSVAMMRGTHEMLYMKGKDSIAAVIPYEKETDARFALFILVPTGDFSTFIQNLSQEMLRGVMNQMEVKAVDLSLPIFQTSTRLYARQFLTDLGMKLAFSDVADFSGIDSQGDLMISTIAHQSIFEINEQGSGIKNLNKSVKIQKIQPEETLEVNRPFFYVLLDIDTGQYLLMGQYTG